MANFTVVNSGSPPAAVANTYFYDGTSITSVPAADGIRTFMNAVATATGRTCLALNGSVGGVSISLLVKGQTAYTNLFAQINAVIQPSDQVMILWDQGEGDADASPHPDENTYKATIGQLHSDMASDMGRTKATCPFFVAGLGTTSVSDGTLTSGTTDAAWQTVKNALFNASIEQAPYFHFSHSNIDLVRLPTDVYHYNGASQGLQGARFAQSVNSVLGLSSPSGDPYWLISSGATVDGTHTNINVTQRLGTDFTPTSGGNGWEVSGDNGATWITATSVHNSATQLQLTHSSISTTNTRLVRYAWGLLPPNASGSNPPSALTFDNSSLSVPLNPTTWDIRPTSLSTLPVPTWRYAMESYPQGGQIQTFSAIPLGPAIGAQKFVILSSRGCK